MKKQLFAAVFMLVAFLASAQMKQAAPKPVQPKPAGPKTTPYVLKKEYDPQVQEMNARISNALGSANAVRREVAGKFDHMNMLDSQLRHIEEILNSASFQIALTSDSLKEARFDMEAFKKQTEQNIESINRQNEEARSMLWILFGASIVMLIAVAGLLLMRISKLKESMHISTQHELQGLKMKMIDEFKSQQQLLKDDLQGLKSKTQTDIYSAKSEVQSQLQSEMRRNKEAVDAEIQAIIDRMSPPSE